MVRLIRALVLIGAVAGTGAGASVPACEISEEVGDYYPQCEEVLKVPDVTSTTNSIVRFASLELTTESEVISSDDRAYASEFQKELNRLGCSAGVPDGIWGKRSERALNRYLELKGRPAQSDLTYSILSELRAEQTEICRQCKSNEVIASGVCVKKKCAQGETLLSSGSCVSKRPATPKQNCYVFRGKTICE